MGFFASDFDPRGTNRKLRSLRVPPYCRGTRICPAKLLPTAISAANFSKFHHGLHHFLANVQDGLYCSGVIFFSEQVACAVRQTQGLASIMTRVAFRTHAFCFRGHYLIIMSFGPQSGHLAGVTSNLGLFCV